MTLQEQILSSVSSFEECIIETPLVEIILDGVSQGLHNEYTVRKLGLAVKRKELTYNSIKIKWRDKTHTIDNQGKVVPYLKDGFFDLSYELAFALLD